MFVYFPVKGAVGLKSLWKWLKLFPIYFFVLFFGVSCMHFFLLLYYND